MKAIEEKVYDARLRWFQVKLDKYDDCDVNVEFCINYGGKDCREICMYAKKRSEKWKANGLKQ